MITLKNISKSYQGKDIILDVSLKIQNNQKIGLVGKNGVGKSTFLKMIAGIEELSGGSIEITGSTKEVGYLKQEFESEDMGKTVTSYIDEAVGLKELQEELEEIQNTDLTVQENFDRFSEIQDKFLNLDGYNFDYKKQITLSGLNLDETVLEKTINTLSEGQKSKILLATLLLKPFDALLLDEPTNNLDISSIKWLENYILNLQVPCIIVSHDRKLLDAVVDKIIEIDQYTKNINEYSGNYTDYISFKKKKTNKQLEEYEKQQEKISEMTASIKQKKTWADAGRYQVMKDNDKYTKGYERDRSSSLASSAKRIEMQIKKMEKVEKPIIHEPLKIEINLPEEVKSNIYIKASNLICGYHNSFTVNVGNFIFNFGDRIIITGNNGTGKSTFLNTLVGKISAIEGDVYLGKGNVFGTLLQNDFSKMKNQDITVEEYLLSSIKCERAKIFNSFIKYGFEYDDRTKTISILSPGERIKLQLLIFSLQEINTLILDEPTNYLDIEALDAIEEVVSSFPGIIIASSHDRVFIEKFKPTYKMDFSDKGVTISIIS